VVSAAKDREETNIALRKGLKALLFRVLQR
jgi:hypothetical protein